MCGAGIDVRILWSIFGIFRLKEFVGSLLVLILTSASNYMKEYVIFYTDGGKSWTLPTKQMAFVMFVGSFCSITVLISLILYFFKLYNLPLCGRIPWRKLEILYCIICAILNFIAMAVAGNSAAGTILPPGVSFPENHHGLYTAVAIFCAAILVMFTAQGFFIYRGVELRSEQKESGGKAETNVAV